jgi:hypothetical protein
MQFHNTLSNKQMAELYVSSWPFLPDSLAGKSLLVQHSALLNHELNQQQQQLCALYVQPYS